MKSNKSMFRVVVILLGYCCQGILFSQPSLTHTKEAPHTRLIAGQFSEQMGHLPDMLTLNPEGKTDLWFSAGCAVNPCVSFGRTLPAINTITDETADLIFHESNKSGTGYAQFGKAVAIIGDINQDGYDDFLVSEPCFNDFLGRVHLYYGGKDDYSECDLTFDSSTARDFGRTMANVGDINNDGYPDFVIGSAYQVNLYLGGPTLTSTPNEVLRDANNKYRFGEALSFAGDVNGDGYNDFLISCPTGAWIASQVTLVFGGDDVHSLETVVFQEEIAGSDFGKTVSSAGDINQDGFDDIIIGAPRYGQQGKCYLYFGGSEPDAFVDLMITGSESGKEFASHVAGAGDVNDDGYDDFMIQTTDYVAGRSEISVFFGAQDPDTTADLALEGPAWQSSPFVSLLGNVDINNDETDDIIIATTKHDSERVELVHYFGGSNFDHSPDRIRVTDLTSPWTAGPSQSLCASGDVNGDGIEDVLVGLCFFKHRMGQAALFYGGESAAKTADAIIPAKDGHGNRFGYSVDNHGDVNGDGYPDLLCSTPCYDNLRGRVYIYLGGETMDTIADITLTGDHNDGSFGAKATFAGDVNGDGYDDVLVSSKILNSPVYLYYGGPDMGNESAMELQNPVVTGSAGFGYDVARAGDVNNDGFDDVLVCAPFLNQRTGTVYLYYGSANMDGIADIVYNGHPQGSGFGVFTSTAGDLDGDGYDDIAIITNQQPGFNRTGGAYIYLGGSVPDNTSPIIIPPHDKIYGVGVDTKPAGDMNGDGYDDLIMGSFSRMAIVFLGEQNFDGSKRVHLDTNDPRLGPSVSGVGDINNDGFSDVLVGNDMVYNTNVDVAIFCGGPVIDAFPDLFLSGPGENTFMGADVAGAGDMDGDGYADIVIGSQYQGDNGAVYLFNGGPLIPSCYPQLQSIDPITTQQDKPLRIEITVTGHPQPTLCVERAPNGMTLDQSTATLNWTPAHDQVGTHDPIVIAENSVGADTLQIEITVNTLTDVTGQSELPTAFALMQNYPNPFNPVTVIEYDCPHSCFVTLEVLDALGKTVAVPISRNQTAGSYSISFDGTFLASGIYFYRLKAGSFSQMHKMMLIK